jgi:hypothetical protein
MKLITVDILSDYLSGATFFQIREEEMSSSDMPSVTFCFYTRKSIDFENEFSAFFEYRSFNHPTRTKAWIDRGYLNQTLFEPLNVVDDNQGFKRYCFLLRWKRPIISYRLVYYQYLLQVSGQWLNLFFKFSHEEHIDHYTVYVTSEENAYGVVTQNWLDGDVIEAQHSENIRRILHQIIINDMCEYNYLEGSCSNQPYYECLADRCKQFFQEGQASVGNEKNVSLPKTDTGILIYTSLHSSQDGVNFCVYVLLCATQIVRNQDLGKDWHTKFSSPG